MFSNNLKINELNTGDIILFHNITTFFGCCIQLCTNSKFSHIGIILKDATYIDDKLKGLYVLHSSALEPQTDVISNKMIKGVQITKLNNLISCYGKNNIKIRKLHLFKPLDTNKLKKVYFDIKDKPYDFNPKHWILAELGYRNKSTDEMFWCSALVGYIFKSMGWLDKPSIERKRSRSDSISSETEWSLLTPKDWTKDFFYTKNCHIGKIKNLTY